MKRFLMIVMFALPLFAQQRNTATPAAGRNAGGEPDVVVDVPNVSVESIVLDVRNVKAHVSLDARVANLVNLSAGADAGIERVKLEINGVHAEVYLVVRLDRVAEIVERALATIDKNPEIVNRLLDSVDNTVGTVGEVANTALQPGGVVSQTVNQLGQTVTRTVDQAGRIVERTLDATGKVISEKVLPPESNQQQQPRRDQ